MLSLRSLPRSLLPLLRLSSSPFSTAAAAPAVPTIRVNVDGKDVDVPQGYSILQACEVAGVHIPRFCYHDRLAVAGNCRMCLVEVEKSPKPVASCAMPAMPGNRIKTSGKVVTKAREGVMEFLLANHPLDCPICDQGGECDLQDQYLEYGRGEGRFREIKRAVEDKNIGPLVKTSMNRCIHCTRCVRFTTDVAGVNTMGTTGRGNHMEIGTYVEKPLDTELSGNVVDLCPVGALTSKPYAFAARPWELQRTHSIDVFDAVGSNIAVHVKGAEVLRVLPRLNEEINEEWIGDKSRHAIDGLKRQRLDMPLIRRGEEFHPITWSEALVIAAEAIKANKGSEMMAVAGEQADAEAMIALKDLFNRLGSNNTRHAQHDRAALTASLRSDYLFNTRIANIEQADFVLLIGANPRMEAAVLTTRLRKAVRGGSQHVAVIGPQFDLAMDHTYLGNNLDIVGQLASGQHQMSAQFKAAKKPMVIVGMGALAAGSAAVSAALGALRAAAPAIERQDWHGINFLHTAASRVAALDMGFVPTGESKPAKFVYLLGAEGVPEGVPVDPKAFIIYAGSHGDAGASAASLVLPAPAYTEKNATYVNMEGRVQRTRAALGRPGDSREDWQIVRAISEMAGTPLPYSTLEQVRERLADVSPTFAAVDGVSPSSAPVSALSYPAASSPVPSAAFAPFYSNYFMTDPISRASVTMAKCSQELPVAKNSYTNHA